MFEPSLEDMPSTSLEEKMASAAIIDGLFVPKKHESMLNPKVRNSGTLKPTLKRTSSSYHIISKNSAIFRNTSGYEEDMQSVGA